LPQPLRLLSVTVDLSLILLDLLLILLFLTLHGIADERAGAESERAADSGSGSGMSHGRADDAACRSAAESADACAFFPGRQRSTGTTGKNDRHETYCKHTCCVRFVTVIHRYVASA
jgi:hypothetical protein